MSKRKRVDKLQNSSAKRFKSLITSKPATNARNASILHPAFASHYRDTCTLKDFLLARLPSTSRIRRRRIESFAAGNPAYKDFLSTTLVGIADEPSSESHEARKRDFKTFTQSQHTTSKTSSEGEQCCIDEVVDFAIWLLFERNPGISRRPSHILCHGLRHSLSVRQDETGLPMRAFVQQHSNASVDALKSKPWTLLLPLLGKDGELIITSLLVDCGLFQRLSTGKANYYQLSGTPIFELPQCRMLDDRQTKCGNVKQNDLSQLHRKLSDITLVRSRILYAKPPLGRDGRIVAGLKHSHVFNRYSDLTSPLSDLHILKYIFPRQFRLHNVFTSLVDRKQTVQSFKDYTFREDEIGHISAQQNSKIPRRLRGSPFGLIQKLRKNHQHCPYTQLLRHYCPIATETGCFITSHKSETPDSIVSPQLLTQLKLTSSIETPASMSAPPDTERSFMPYATAANHVSAYCQSVIFYLLPRPALGLGSDADHNWKIITEFVRRFVEMRRFESVNLHEIVQRLRIGTITWLRPPASKSDSRLSLSDRTKRLEILHEFIYFVFDSILITLIKSNFYVTETGLHRNRLFYFRHDIWRRLSAPSLDSLRMGLFQPLSPHQVRSAFQSNQLGYSQIRLLPKDHGTRPITNLRRRAVKTVNGLRTLGSSVNTTLAPVFNVLNYEKRRDPNRLGTALFSVDDLHERLVRFKSTIDWASQKRFYFVKTDVRSCFDSIPQDKLFSLIQSLFSEDRYRITKHVESKWLAKDSRTGEGYMINKFIGSARPLDCLPALSIDEASEIAVQKRNTTYTAIGQERIATRTQLQKLLHNHIKDNIVRIGRKHYRQTEGIPQGSILSSLLCSLFYADFEQHCLAFLHLNQSLLLRLIDDFLLITTDVNQARCFATAMVDGAEQYGITVNTEKSLVNFEMTLYGHRIPRKHGATKFPYCGMTIDTQSLEVSRERSKKDIHVGNALTVDVHGRASLAFERRMLMALRIQLHAMLLDTRLNSRRQVFTTLLECFAETAMKMHQYLTNMPRSKRPDSSQIIRLIQQLIRMSLSISRGRREGERSVISRSQLCWLAATAMGEVLSRKQSSYSSILAWTSALQQETSTSMIMKKKDLEAITQQALSSFSGLFY